MFYSASLIEILNKVHINTVKPQLQRMDELSLTQKQDNTYSIILYCVRWTPHMRPTRAGELHAITVPNNQFHLYCWNVLWESSKFESAKELTGSCGKRTLGALGKHKTKLRRSSRLSTKPIPNPPKVGWARISHWRARALACTIYININMNIWFFVWDTVLPFLPYFRKRNLLPTSDPEKICKIRPHCQENIFKQKYIVSIDEIKQL